METKETLNRIVLEALKEKKIDRATCMQIIKDINQDKVKQDIAVIGMSGLYAKADSLEAYWENLKGKVEGITSLPPNRKKLVGMDLPMAMGYLDNIEQFDAPFFNMTEEEATAINPIQRILLEKTWEALEDAGYAPNAIKGTSTGVYIGYESGYQETYKSSKSSLMSPDITTEFGTMPAMTASRISYFFDLKGPSMLIDSVCSSGAMSVHMAATAINQKECKMAIVGGVNVINLQGQRGMQHVETTVGKIAVFDKTATGILWGEGCGIVILKSLDEALKDGDHIHAVIKGTAINNDGKSSELTSPNFKTQAQVIQKAWEKAKIDPETVNYIETNGTGTLIGDSIEFKAIKESFSKYTNKKQFCGIGSVKPNIGHSVGASAIASLQKVILSLEHRQMLPVVNFNEPNPLIDFNNSPCYVNDRLREWKKVGDTPRRAGVNSFSFARTNCHIVVEEAPERPIEEAKEKNYLFLLSAKNQTSLLGNIKKYNKFFEKDKELSIRDICYTVAKGREQHPYRLAMIVKDMKDLKEKMKVMEAIYVNGETVDNVFYNKLLKIYPSKRDEMAFVNEINKQGEAIIVAHQDIASFDYKKLEVLAELYIQGMNIDWGKYYVVEPCFRVSLPTYAFDKKAYWNKKPLTLEEDTEEDIDNMGLEEFQNYEEESIAPYMRYNTEIKNIDVTLVGGNRDYTDTEKTIATIWGRILGQETIDFTTSFQELGGDSVSLIKVEIAVEEEFDIDLEEEDIMLDYSSVEAQALLIEEIMSH